ncbi:hypothetical protein LTR64_004461 [Lithohypha guttulata]|uniref:uncharacterized protein n=1 Tax=Lithohypha guttulata TaxID=1690604 RepID=UPI00315C6045
MPPKKASGAAQAAKAVNKKKQAEDKQVPSRAKQEQKDDVVMEDETTNPKDEAVKEDQKEEAPAKEKAETGQKRKTPPTSGGSKPPKKEQRQGSRVSSRTAGAGADELEAANSGKFKKCYSLTPPSLFTPFEHLVTAHLISKPLSHTLGMRSARTLLNDPYSFSTPGKMRAAGEKKIWDALEEARTQHRQKTASYLYDMAVQYADPNNKDDTNNMGDSDEMLELATRANDGGSRATIEYIKSTVKGMGDTGAQIFCRRVQACEGWGEAIWPYADPRSIDALRELGVKVADAENLQEMIESDVDWDNVGDMGLLEEKKGVDDKDYEVQVAVELVTVLERAIGCVLEGKVDQLRSAAAGFGK